MCFFVTIAVPSNAVERVRTAHAARGMRIAPTANASARAAAGPGRVPLLVTTGGCSCDWYKPPSGSEAESKIANARARYERMGWSSAKIERALEGMARSPRHELGLHPEVREFLCAVARDCGSVAVWVHDFARDAEVEPYTMTKRENWAWSAILAQAAALATDTIAEISAARAASKG